MSSRRRFRAESFCRNPCLSLIRSWEKDLESNVSQEARENKETFLVAVPIEDLRDPISEGHHIIAIRVGDKSG